MICCRASNSSIGLINPHSGGTPMSRFSRRSFVAGLSTIPFALWFEKYAVAQTKLRIRYNVTSINGQKMLKIYRQTVGTMVGTAESSPVGWLFQWYTHNV